METSVVGSSTAVIEAKSVGSARAIGWLKDGFGLFVKAPGLWIGITIVLFVIGAVLNAIPVGGVVFTLITPALNAGLMLGCAELAAGRPLKFEHLFAGFTGGRAGPLLVLGALTLAVFVAMGVIVFGAAFATIGTAVLAGNVEGVNPVGVLLLMLVALAVMVPVSMATWFAPPLVTLGGLKPVAALKASFAGCMKNVGAFLIYGLLAMLLFVIGGIPLLLGWLVVIPMLIASMYLGYRDIFTS